MKIAISHAIQVGPYGGGNNFVKNLSEYLIKHGHNVIYDLNDNDVEIILLIDPRIRSSNVNFAAARILKYIKKNPNAIVVHRINECDERKGTKTMNLRLRIANYCADHTVFVGGWLRALPLTYRADPKYQSVILNGANTTIFNSDGYCPWDKQSPLKLVTHHWGGNWMKGFDVYSRLDELLGQPKWHQRVEFTYIGNLPQHFQFKHVKYLEPLSGLALATELKRHHVYLTASINEPGGNHQIEGGICGLPLIYRNSGCMPEYCEGFGIMFDGTNVEPAIERMFIEYPRWRQAIENFPHRAERMCDEYVALFERLIAEKHHLITQRTAKHSWLFEFANLLPI
ncbi:MAG: hypothetical protein Tsb005_05130 [Gammaproteobacteria bacterium]